ncbi:MAG: divergent PAP2 family protein, partial [Salinispira sp.]
MTLLAALSAQLFCQLLKFIVYSLREGRITLKYFFISGGFISAHSALVSTLVAYLALTGNVG